LSSASRSPPPAFATFQLPPAARTIDDIGRYPDPRRMAIRQFHLEYRLNADFSFLGLPLASHIVSTQPRDAWQSLDALPTQSWQSDLVLRFPRDLYAGASTEQRTAVPRSLFVVAGESF
jgi:hypothetical protein